MISTFEIGEGKIEMKKGLLIKKKKFFFEVNLIDWILVGFFSCFILLLSLLVTDSINFP